MFFSADVSADSVVSHQSPRSVSVGLRRWVAVGLLTAVAALSGCAAGPTPDPRDPFERFNRDVEKFNTAVDEAVLKPVATTYARATPDPVRTAINNFFGNLSDIWSTINTGLQLRGEDTAVNFMRVNVNTVFGLGGLIDIASDMGLYRNKADFGQTMGYWGVPAGPYLVLPVLGPSTVRDTVGMGVESKGDLLMTMDNVPTRNSLYVLRGVEKRAGLLRAGAVLEEAALDKYSFTREVFLQRRQSVIDAQRNRNEE
jgi:phospholipid-binding lipoprotein MlaA